MALFVLFTIRSFHLQPLTHNPQPPVMNATLPTTDRVYTAEFGGMLVKDPSFGQIGWLESEPGKKRVRVLFDRNGIPRRYPVESGHDLLCGFYSASRVYATCGQDEFDQ
jgi:hypothetical protein